MNQTTKVPTQRPVVIVLGPHVDAISGVSSHLGVLFGSHLDNRFTLVHFQVGSEGHTESRPGRLWRLLFSPFALVAAIRRHHATILHLNTSLDARAFWRDLAYMIVARVSRVRVVWQVHGGALPEAFFGSGLKGFLLRGTLRLPDAIVTLSRSELEVYRRFVPHQCVVRIPNAIDVWPYLHRRRARSDPGTPLRLVYLGRLVADKGLDELLRGFASACSSGAPAHLSIAGSGPGAARLKASVTALGLENVSLLGAVTRRQKVGLLGRSDVFVLPSYREGLPYALLEAMAAATAVIVTRVGAIPDVVEEGVHGFFVPVRDAEAIASVISEFARDRDALLRMQIASRHRVATAYGTTHLAAQFGALYTSLCAGGGGTIGAERHMADS
jgi:glycosyltransferase involved in cell wall biosynthesis